MIYNSNLETFRDFVDFDADSPCVWVVYPAGGAGDLLASLINFHYIETGAKFYGITHTGQVVFRPSDQKLTNIKYINLKNGKLLDISSQFFFDIAEELSKLNISYSKFDQFLFSNHAFHRCSIEKILTTFSGSKIIRILPNSEDEYRVCKWMYYYKNCNKVTNIEEINEAYYQDKLLDPRVLEISMVDFVDPTKFESTYEKILLHLDLKIPLVRYNFIKFWLDQQHPIAKTHITKLFAT